MPLTSKGEEIKTAMEKEYGSEKGEQVLYASKNAGTISGIDSARGDEIVKIGGGYTAEKERDGSWSLYGAVEHYIKGGFKSAAEAKAHLKSRGDDFDPAQLHDSLKSMADACEKLDRRVDAYCARRADAFAEQPAQDTKRGHLAK